MLELYGTTDHGITLHDTFDFNFNSNRILDRLLDYSTAYSITRPPYRAHSTALLDSHNSTVHSPGAFVAPTQPP